MAYQYHDYDRIIKRNYDDSTDDDDDVGLPAVKIRKEEANPSESSNRIQFFVRLFSGGKTLVLQADSTDYVSSVHQKIQSITGIQVSQLAYGVPGVEQRLIYGGKQLEMDQTLSECDVQNDSCLQLVGRMRSTRFSSAWKLLNVLISLISDHCNRNHHPGPVDTALIKKMLAKFLTMAPKDETKSEEYFQVFIYSSVPAALVKLYVSPSQFNKDLADECIRKFINSCKENFPNDIYRRCVHIVLEFCKLLRGAAGSDDALYGFCRSSLADIMEWYDEDAMDVLGLRDSFPFVSEFAARFSRAFGLSVEGSGEFMGLSSSDVREFIKFMHPVKSAIWCQETFDCPITFPLCERDGSKKAGSKRSKMHDYREQIEGMHRMYCDLLDKLEPCLKKLESWLASEENRRGESIESIVLCWSQYLRILKELHRISEMYKGLEEVFWEKMGQRKVSLYFLIVRLSKGSRDYLWILKHRAVASFEIRRFFAMMMLLEGGKKRWELYELLIDRSHLLEESFEYIGHADPRSLQGFLLVEFKNENAAGPGVLREWFSLVCQAIFDTKYGLFVSCPKERRKLFPNPASKLDPLDLEYYIFAGRMIALALLYGVQVSIAFDRVFFLQLAEKRISLEDIKDADPYLYSGCKNILEMDPVILDQDTLGLTFVCEVEELGSMKVVELCDNGKDIVVNSENRVKYVDLLIRHRFVKSIAKQVDHFSRGFSDIITNIWLRRSFFEILNPEDLDCMLHGSQNVVSIEDWRAHTDYNGYEENDPEISWFWEIVTGMADEQRKALLFFWTSIKSLPVEGFRGLASRLQIYRTSESYDCLPSSHTCFYRLDFPPYPSMAVMRDRLNIITQDHFCYSFGTG